MAVTVSGLCCLGALLLVACPTLRPHRNAILTGTLAVRVNPFVQSNELHPAYCHRHCKLIRPALQGFMLMMQDHNQAALWLVWCDHPGCSLYEVTRVCSNCLMKA